MQGVPYLLGIPHATGYPLFVLLGWIFSHAIAIDSLAFRMNLFGAVCIAATCLVGVLTALRIGVGPVTSLGAFLCFAWARIVWFHAAQADTQDLALFFQALTIFYLCGWLQDKRTRDIVGAAAAFGAALAVHPISLWLVPAFAFAKLARVRNLNISNVGASAMAFALLLCCYAYLPLRAAGLEHRPVDSVQMLAPPAARVYWDVNAPSTRHGFLAEVTGASLGATPLWRSIVDPRRWLGYLQSAYATIHSMYGIVLVVVIAFGVILLLQRRSALCAMLLIAALSIAFTAFALAPVEGDPARYFMLLLWIAALFAGAITVEFNWTIDPRRIVWALVLLGNALYLLISSSSVAASQRSVTDRPLIAWVAKLVPQRSIVVAPWSEATTLAYGAYADGSLAGRTIVASHPLALSAHYPTWSKQEPVYVLSSSAKPFNNPRFRPIGSPNLGYSLYEYVPVK